MAPDPGWASPPGEFYRSSVAFFQYPEKEDIPPPNLGMGKCATIQSKKEAFNLTPVKIKYADPVPPLLSSSLRLALTVRHPCHR